MICVDVASRWRWRAVVVGGVGREVKWVEGWWRWDVRNFLVYVVGVG